LVEIAEDVCGDILHDFQKLENENKHLKEQLVFLFPFLWFVLNRKKKYMIGSIQIRNSTIKGYGNHNCFGQKKLFIFFF